MSIASLNVCASLKFILTLNPHTVLVKGEAFGGDYHEGFSFKNVGDSLRKGASVCVGGSLFLLLTPSLYLSIQHSSPLEGARTRYHLGRRNQVLARH